MGGNVYLRTNRFEVKLEGITFKTKDFEYLCAMDFLFPEGKVWDRPPVVGLDVMRHPRDPSVLLVMLCFGVGCVILRFVAGEALPATIHKFLADKRIHFVGFGIPEKKDLFPFEELGLRKSKVDIGYLAAKILKQPKCKTWELSELARKVLGIKRMVGLTEASSFERHEQIKGAICQLFITSIIAMGLLRATDKKKLDGSHKKSSFLKNLNSLQLLAEGLFKLPKGKKKNEKTEVEEEEDSIHVHIGEMVSMLGDDDSEEESPLGNSLIDGKTQKNDADAAVEVDSSINDLTDSEGKGSDSSNSVAHNRDKDTDTEENSSDDYSSKETVSTNKMPLKGILKCPSTGLRSCKLSASQPASPSRPIDQAARLRRANSKGCNVSFKCQ